MMSQKNDHLKTPWIDQNAEHLDEIRRQIWDYAEPGLEEFKSSALLKKTLLESGFDIEEGQSGIETAFKATWGTGKPVIGFLGEFDALPGMSQKACCAREAVPERSWGHGCGHNLLGTSAMAAAIELKEQMARENLPGTVVFWGCPDEEGSQAKIFLARDHHFDGLDAALTMHPGIANYANEGAAAAFFSAEFTFTGTPSHAAAAPEDGRSALDALELMHSGLNYLREHVPRDISIHYVTVNGGDRPNVVPAFARNWLIVRGPSVTQVRQVFARIEKIAQGACLMTETSYESCIKTATYHFNVNKTMVELAAGCMRDLGGIAWTAAEEDAAREMAAEYTKEQRWASIRNYTTEEGMKHLKDQVLHSDVLPPLGRPFYTLGSTDVSDVSWIVPTLEIVTCCRPVGVAAHTWQQSACAGMSIGQKGMELAARTMAATGRRLLTEPQLLARVQKEFLSSTGGRAYEPIISKDSRPGKHS